MVSADLWLLSLENLYCRASAPSPPTTTTTTSTGSGLTFTASGSVVFQMATLGAPWTDCGTQLMWGLCIICQLSCEAQLGLSRGTHLTIALMSFGSKWRHTALKEGDCLFFTPLWCQRHTNSALPIWEEKVIKSTIKRRTKEAAGARVGWRSEEVTAVNVTRCCRGPDSRYTTSYRCTA